MLVYVGAVFLPLAGALIAGLFGRFIGDRGAQIVTCTFMGIAAICATIVFFRVGFAEGAGYLRLFTWFDSAAFQVDWGLRYDPLSAIMVFTVSVVSFLIHVYSIGYMAKDPSIPRFMAYLSLFTFFMLALVTANNFVQLYFGWEGVGLVSYLLIGFWYTRPAANAAAIKAFIVNRVGDFGLGLGIVAIFLVFGSVDFDVVFASAPGVAGERFHFLGMELDILTTVCILLFIGAMGKSAQLGLHTWLPDAMEGPTPVSALIHAATMVTAGVFLVARCSPLFEYAPTALAVVTVIGGATAIVAATIGLVQNDIKRVIAYSTMSQLGYMFFACGASAYAAGIMHLTTHAYFKALLFLGAGSVIHAMSDEQDMRKMGGIWRMIPLTYMVMWVGSLSLAGIPFFAGFFSKDIILEAAWGAHSIFGTYGFVLGIMAALLTALYSWRLLIMTFHGSPRADEKVMAHVHESPPVMMIPLVLLAIGAIFSGYLFLFLVEPDGSFWGGSILVLPHNESLEAAHHAPFWVKALPTVVGVAGLVLAYLGYVVFPQVPAELARRFRALYLVLLNKWYFDELYDFLFVRASKRLGRALWRGGDGALIDGIGPDGVASVVAAITRRAVRLQSGYLYHYAFAMLIGVAAFVTWYLVGNLG